MNGNDRRRRTEQVLVGGVNSPVRAFRAVGASPLVVERAEGPYLFDCSGKRYIDLCMGWGAVILGHAHPAVVSAVKDSAARGLVTGFTGPAEVELAELTAHMHPAAEKVRLTASGTEAVMSAVRLARGYTGRNLVVRFEGAYHGHADHLLVETGNDEPYGASPTSKGIPSPLVSCTRLVPYNDTASLDALLRREGERVACVLVEAVQANCSLLAPTEDFLQSVRSLCDEYGCLLVFDEVITGFRLSYGGASSIFGVTPDLVCLGKVMGGGLPVGCFAGRTEIMEHLSPEGDVYHAGTFAGNPVCTAAGTAVLKELLRTKPYGELDAAAGRICATLAVAFTEAGITAWVRHVGSIFAVSFGVEKALDYTEIRKQDTATFAAFHRACMEEGLLLPPSPLEVCFLSTAHLDVLDETCDRLRAAVHRMKEVSR